MAEKQRLHSGMLTPADLRRAKAGPLGGKDPLAWMQDQIDELVLAIWCIRSRTDPTFTWEQAEVTPMGEFILGPEPEDVEPPPPTAGPGLNGSGPGSEAGSEPRVSLPSAASTG